VIDEVGAMQMLVPPSKRKKTITAKEIEAVIATMARIPPKSVERRQEGARARWKRDLKRVVFGQDKAIELLSTAIKLSPRGPARSRQADRQLSCSPAHRRRQDRSRAPARQHHGHPAAALRHVRVYGAPQRSAA
jgi:hypothetical protein